MSSFEGPPLTLGAESDDPIFQIACWSSLKTTAYFHFQVGLQRPHPHASENISQWQSHVLHVCTPYAPPFIHECSEDIITLVDEHILALCSPLMYLKMTIVVVEALFVSFMPSFKPFKLGFNDWMNGATLIHWAHILRSPCHHSNRFLYIAGTSVVVNNSNDWAHLSYSWP